MEMLAPQDTHTHLKNTHTFKEQSCGANARLSLSHVSLPYGRLLFLTFEIFFSLLLPLPLFLSNSHSCGAHPPSPLAHVRTQTYMQTHARSLLFCMAPSHSVLSLKGTAFQARIKQMRLRKRCCAHFG